jgi:hypothetical protein
MSELEDLRAEVAKLRDDNEVLNNWIDAFAELIAGARHLIDGGAELIEGYRAFGQEEREARRSHLDEWNRRQKEIAERRATTVRALRRAGKSATRVELETGIKPAKQRDLLRRYPEQIPVTPTD